LHFRLSAGVDWWTEEGIVAQDRAVFWMSVVVLLGAGVLVGQVKAVMIAAMAGVILAYRNDRIARSEPRRASTLGHVSLDPSERSAARQERIKPSF
jgi:hypothetical protein